MLTDVHRYSFFLRPKAKQAICNALVALLNETANFAFIFLEALTSNFFTIGPVVKKLDFNTFTFKPNGGLELGVDFSPSSDATYRYLSETTEYTKSIDQDSKNLRANIGFDLITDNGFSIMTIYERNQSDNAHSDTLYIGFGYIPTDDIEYAMTLDNDKASLSYKRDLNGFDIRMSSNYSLMSQIPEYGATLEIVNTF